MGKGSFLLGVGVGYVLGTRAGRERYEQIKERATSVWNNPQVRQKVSSVEQTAKSAADTAIHKVGERLPGGGSGSSESTTPEPATANASPRAS